MPTTRYPSRSARMVIARMAGLRPGTSPPPVRIAMVPFDGVIGVKTTLVDCGHHRSDGRLILFSRANPIHFLDGKDEDLPVSHFARGAGRENGTHRRLHEVIRDSDLETHLVVQLHLHRHPPVRLDFLDLSAVPLHPADREAAHV